MKTNILLSVAAGLLSLAVVGCGGNGTTGNDMGGTHGGGGPDMMQPACVKNPMSDPDFLNSCPPAGVDKFDITPFYPALAPNGQLPTIP